MAFRDQYPDRFAIWRPAAGDVEDIAFRRWLAASQTDITPTIADLDAAISANKSAAEELALIRGKLPLV